MAWSRSLRSSYRHVLLLQAGLPCALILTLLLRVWSLTQSIASIHVRSRRGGNGTAVPLSPVELRSFDFASVVGGSMACGSVMFAILEVIAAIFPVVKLVLYLMIWYIRQPLSGSARGNVLFVLDQGGRLALVDHCFIGGLVVMMTLNLFEGFLPAHALLVVEGSIGPGMVGGILSTIVCSLLGHLMLHLHLCDQRHKTGVFSASATKQQKSSGSTSADDELVFFRDGTRSNTAASSSVEMIGSFVAQFKRDDPRHRSRSLGQMLLCSESTTCGTRRVRAAALVAMGLMWVASLALVIKAYTAVLLRFEVSGAAVNKFWTGPNTITFTMTSLAIEMPPGFDFKSAGAIMVLGAYAAQLILGPAAAFLSWLFLWSTPMRRNQQLRLLRSLKYTFCWCGLDLLLICTFAAARHLDDVIRQLFSEMKLCELILDLLFRRTKGSRTTLSTTTCFELSSSYGPASSALLGAFVLSVVLQSVTVVCGGRLHSEGETSASCSLLLDDKMKQLGSNGSQYPTLRSVVKASPVRSPAFARIRAASMEKPSLATPEPFNSPQTNRVSPDGIDEVFRSPPSSTRRRTQTPSSRHPQSPVDSV